MAEGLFADIRLITGRPLRDAVRNGLNRISQGIGEHLSQQVFSQLIALFETKKCTPDNLKSIAHDAGILLVALVCGGMDKLNADIISIMPSFEDTMCDIRRRGVQPTVSTVLKYIKIRLSQSHRLSEIHRDLFLDFLTNATDTQMTLRGIQTEAVENASGSAL